MAKQRHGRGKKWAIGLGVAVLLYTVGGFFVLPAIIKSQLLQRLPALTHRNVAIQEVKLNPYALSLTVRGLSLTESNGDEFASLGELYVDFESVSLLKRGLVFKEISLKKPSANIIRLKDGTFNFANLQTNAAPSETAPKTNGPLPLVIIDELNIEEGRFTFTDLSRKTPYQNRLEPINIRFTDFTTRPKDGSPYSIAVGMEDGSSIAWAGDISIAPLHTAGTFKLTGLQLKKYAPYIEDAAPLQILGGQVGLQTDYHFAMAGDAMSVTVSNAVLDLSGVQISQAEPKPKQMSVEQLRLSVSGVAFNSASNSLDVAEVRLIDLKTGLTLLPGAATTSAVAQVATPAPPTPKPAATRTNEFQLRIGEIALDNASFHFVDESVKPPVESSIGDFNGSVKGLTSDLNTVAAVDFKGKVNNYAPFSIRGKINPLSSDLFVDLAISLKDVTLMAESPYAAKYAGYALDKGALSLDLRYSIIQRELKAENKVRVDQLQLGEASNSPDAIKVPLKLGIALMQDRHGVIALNVPVNGRLDDPKFRLGPLITEAFMNILTKAVTKPFALLGSVFGGGDDLDHVLFDVGTADFTVGEVGKLDTLETALYERPALKLSIAGSIDPVKDRTALAKRKLERKLGELRMKELQASGQKATSVDSVRLTPADRDRLLKLAYAEALGLVSKNTSGARASTVLTHLTTKQNFEPLNKSKNADESKNEAAKGAVSVADMETKLLELTEITPEDFKKLMTKRADAVQSYLLQGGKVTTERLTLVDPKAVDASYQGASRVNLTLQ